MLSTKRCRQILGSSIDLSDEKLELLRDHMTALADVVVDAIGGGTPRRRDDGPRSLDEALGLLPSDDGEQLEERSAIKEFDAEMQRDVAERSALGDYLRDKFNLGNSARCNEGVN